MNTAYIGIGSNLGDRHQNCIRATQMMREIPGCQILSVSGWYLTKPVGVVGQEWYVNGVAGLATSASAQELLRYLYHIESDMGRVRSAKWGPRIIDLDILLYGNEMIDSENLKIPHPLMHLRRFVLVPLAQLAPDVIHPGLGLTIGELLKRLPEDDQEVRAVKE